MPLLLVLILMKMLFTPISVEASRDQVNQENEQVCGFCQSQETAGIALDIAWRLAKGRLDNLLELEADLLRFFSEASLAEKFTGSFIEYSCTSHENGGEASYQTLALTEPGKLFFSPWRVSIDHSVFNGCSADDTKANEVLLHEAFHVRAGIQAQASRGEMFGIEAIRSSAAEMLAFSGELGIDQSKTGPEKLRLITKFDAAELPETLRQSLPYHERVFYNSLMEAACEELLAIRINEDTWAAAIEIFYEANWSLPATYNSYFLFDAWRSKSFMLSMVGMRGRRCTGLLSDAEWYERDKTSGAFYALP